MKRRTSPELVEVRTVLSRAKSAIARIDYVSTPHTEHEASMMRSALLTTIDVLEKVEKAYGHSEQ